MWLGRRSQIRGAETVTEAADGDNGAWPADRSLASVKAPNASPGILVGQSDSHLSAPDDALLPGVRLHLDAVDAFLALRATAAQADFDLAVISSFRSFEKQLSIWNRKATGQLPVLDTRAQPLDIASLSEEELVFSILRWSALPGASRHHWGTDLDVYDRAATPDGYEIELIPAEVDPGGMFAPLHVWLDERIASDAAYGFFRPYDIDRNGVAPERWHLSYSPVSSVYMRLLTPTLLRQTIETAEMRLKEVVLANLDAIFERFVTNTNRTLA
jgi:LAS superfamily LD-carboxypeptidase LdcB